MENNQNENNVSQEYVQLKEKKSGNNIWYWLLALLLLLLFGWYAYTAGWFSGNKSNKDLQANQGEMIPVESDGAIGDGATAPDAVPANVDNMSISTLESFPVQKNLTLTGNLADGCTYLNDPQIIRDGNNFYVQLTTRREGETCTQALVPYEKTISLDVVGLPAGVYNVFVNGAQTTFELDQDNKLDFMAGEEK